MDLYQSMLILELRLGGVEHLKSSTHPAVLNNITMLSWCLRNKSRQLSENASRFFPKAVHWSDRRLDSRNLLKELKTASLSDSLLFCSTNLKLYRDSVCFKHTVKMKADAYTPHTPCPCCSWCLYRLVITPNNTHICQFRCNLKAKTKD